MSSKITKKIVSIVLAISMGFALASPSFASVYAKVFNKESTTLEESSVAVAEEKGKHDKAGSVESLALELSGPSTYATNIVKWKKDVFSIEVDSSVNYAVKGLSYVFDYLEDFTISYDFAVAGQSTDDWCFKFAEPSGLSWIKLGAGESVVVNGTISNEFRTLLAAGKITYGTYKILFNTDIAGMSGDSTDIHITFDTVSGAFSKADYGVNPNASDFLSTLEYGDPTNDPSTINAEWIVTLPNLSKISFASEADFKAFITYTGENALEDGEYTVALKVKGKTVNGGDIPEPVYTTHGETKFSVEFPNPTVVIDKTENPTNIVVEKKLIDSTYMWEVSDSEGNLVTALTGTGTAVDTSTVLDSAIYKNLDSGTYTVRITETSASGFSAFTENDFTILNPKTTTTFDTNVNPNLGTGTKNMIDSVTTWYITDRNDASVIADGTGLSVSDTVFKALAEGEYNLSFKEVSHYNGKTHESKQPFEVINPLTSAEVDKPVNPTGSDGGKKMPSGQSDVTWVIKNENDDLVDSGSGQHVTKDKFDTLPEGNYIIEYTETSNYNSTNDVKSTPFEIKNPLTSAKVDRPTDPTSATGRKNLTGDDSVVTWVIKDSVGVPVKTGTGQTVGKSTFADLVEGDYEIEFTETSNYNNTVDTKTASFAVKEPKTSTHIGGTVGTSGAIYNPTQITGTQKQPDSTLEWSIKDENGIVVQTGTGDNVPKDILDALEEGSYTVSFLETTTTGKTHTSSGEFVVALPDPETVIDNVVNPKSITGVPKNENWDVVWDIKDDTGKVVESGVGTVVPKEALDKLEDGNYTVTFTETCPDIPSLTDYDTKAFEIKRVSTSPSGGSTETNPSGKVTTITPQTGDSGQTQLFLAIFFAVLSIIAISLGFVHMFYDKKRKQ